MKQWYLPTMSEVVLQDSPLFQAQRSAAQQRVRAEREWSGAIAALNLLLHNDFEAGLLSLGGVVLAGPVPLLSQPGLQGAIASWTFTASPFWSNTWMPFRLLPSCDREQVKSDTATDTLPLLPTDPLSQEQFCVVLTERLSVVMVLGETPEGDSAFLYSFDPAVIGRAWQLLRARLLFSGAAALKKIEALINKMPPVSPDYRRVTEFSHLLLTLVPDAVELESIAVGPTSQPGTDAANAGAFWNGAKKGKASRPQQSETVGRPKGDRQTHRSHDAGRSLEALTQSPESFDAELLQAIAHEINTPLTTIRTLTRLLLKRKDLSPDVLKRLTIIDQECTEQIDRFNLIFRAVELEKATHTRPVTPLAPISLTQLFQRHVPRWEQLALQRNLSLNVRLPQKLPMVVTDPTMLDQVLTGLIDRITQTLPPNSHIQISVTLAGHQLKLQFQSQMEDVGVSHNGSTAAYQAVTPLKALGQLLMFQPETGNLSLNLAVTKNLFQALGGKLIVRQRPQQGEVLTIFLPLENRRQDDATMLG